MMLQLLKRQSPGRIIALGFALVILLGSVLLSLPCSIQDGVTVRYIDALYTSTSAVCVTGLIAIDAGDTFTPLGQFFLGALIQIGGLGVTAVGVGVILAMGKKINLKGRNIIREAMNLDSGKGTVRFIKSVFLTTLAFELSGAVLSFLVFVQDYPPLRAAGISLFHSVAAFNNSGFDILGNFQNLIPYQDNVLLNLVTCGLIFFGGIGFLVIREIISKRFRWKKFSMHTKVVLSVSAVLIVAGTILIKLTEHVTWLGAFFHSVSARTAGFSTYPLGTFSNAGLLVLTVLMFIGASPGSTGGGIKTTTLLVLIMTVVSYMQSKNDVEIMKHKIDKLAVYRTLTVTLLSLTAVILCFSVLYFTLPEDGRGVQCLFEAVSAFSTSGLSAGITEISGTPGRILLIITMFIGRVGPVSLVLSMLVNSAKRKNIVYPDGQIIVG